MIGGGVKGVFRDADQVQTDSNFIITFQLSCCFKYLKKIKYIQGKISLKNFILCFSKF